TTVSVSTLGALAEADVSSELPKIPAQFNGANSAYIFGKGNNKFEPNSNMTRAEACTVFARLILSKTEIPSGYKTRFTDVKEGDWFYNAIAFLDQTGYFFRNKNTTYKPNEPITRAEFVDLANSASMLAAGKGDIKFRDVDSEHFYYSSIMAAASSGLVNGYEDNTFRPDNTITRAEVVTVINRLLGFTVSDKTVSESRLENVFDDIKTHWGRLNILMASNSNVHGEYYYNATLDGVEESSSEITFKNKHFSFSINKKNGKVTEFINLYTGENVNNGSQQFLYLNTDAGNKVLPTAVRLDGNRIKFSFKDGVDVYVIVEVKDNYMTFEVDSEVPDTFSSITFASLNTTIVTSEDEDSFMLNSMGMTAWVNPVNKGFRAGAVSSIAHAYTKFDKGTFGSKIGVVFSKRGDAIKYLQELTDAIDTSVGLASRAGGAYAQEWKGNFGDYVIFDSTKPEDVEKTIAIATQLGIDQIDIHQSGSSFRQGDMYFHNTETGTAKEFYETVGKKYIDAGFELGLHTYAYYITYKSDPILSNPKWQRDLETLETYTLRKSLTKFRRTIPTEEDASGFDTTVSFFYRNSRYVLIDEEIILIGSGTEDGFINVTRGQCGTSPAEHSAGATIYHLSGYFNMFAPKLGSELFYHIADLTAKTYNEGGFSMIYLDAIDGITSHLEDSNDQFYYFQMFLHRVVSQCKKSPIIETSSSAPQEWNVRGRTGAWDYPTRAIKQFIANHVSVNLGTHRTNLTSTLGWFNFQPDADGVSGMKNTISKT
ncbi:MAG: S-layer homology domain-containing protein, partial [Clostridia bacterium]|nr:S-layer homology domain-containing protein [Clostridia bacterium]